MIGLVETGQAGSNKYPDLGIGGVIGLIQETGCLQWDIEVIAAMRVTNGKLEMKSHLALLFFDHCANKGIVTTFKGGLMFELSVTLEEL
ncbi:hypothetical protein E3N88_29619 [Mikania micrantha]|uniref:Uncharacterized protein n=1 Tax=Mikania micrantha TaxID=192012 RepID=A0A5N6MJZ6_9ASTR|nr:hypothetical protein E3N88_29619 [Mikania micrantha]